MRHFGLVPLTFDRIRTKSAQPPFVTKPFNSGSRCLSERYQLRAHLDLCRQQFIGVFFAWLRSSTNMDHIKDVRDTLSLSAGSR